MLRTKRPDESLKLAGYCRPLAVRGRSGERPAAVFQHAHECPARKVRRRAIVGHEGQADPRSSMAVRWRSNIMIKRGLQALGIVALQGAGALPQFNERRSVEVSRARAFSRPTTSWPSIERRSPAAARQPRTPRRRRRTAP